MKRIKLVLVGMSIMLVFTVGCKKQDKDIIPEKPDQIEIEDEDISGQIENEVEKEDEEIIIEEDKDQDISVPNENKDADDGKEDAKGLVKEPVKVPVKELIKEPVKKPAKEPVKDKEPVEEPVQDDTKIGKVHSDIKDALGENYTPNMAMAPEQLEGILGLSLDELGGHIAEAPMISMQVDTFIAISANKDNVKTVETALKEYRRYLLEESMQYPMNMAKIQASKVITIKNDVYLIMLGAYDDREEITEEEALEFANSEVKKIEDIIKKSYK